MKRLAERLQDGETIEFRPRGGSMTGLVESGDLVVVKPADSAKVGDIVLCKVRGNYYLHKVTAIDSKGRWQISNNRGRTNGWTKQIFGVLVENKGQ